jgi:hypothetical protein
MAINNDSSINVNNQSSGNITPVDTSAVLMTEGVVVQRQRMVLADNIDPAAFAKILSLKPFGNEYAVLVRLLQNAELEEILGKLSDIYDKLDGVEQPSFNEWGRLKTEIFYPVTGYTDCSSTIKIGGQAQTLFKGINVKGFEVQNLSNDPLGISIISNSPVIGNPGTITLNAGAIPSAGGAYQTAANFGYFKTLTVSIIGATAGDGFTAHYW